ncbi:hypothetical protein SDC9_175681 [bioreactor metagenome]|uniref:Uncharacterized protein n=1 Tax=bioreactor metagenome TaxID=1076179 RepID=A0A645GPU0_9ZZZZ
MLLPCIMALYWLINYSLCLQNAILPPLYLYIIELFIVRLNATILFNKLNAMTKLGRGCVYNVN